MLTRDTWIQDKNTLKDFLKCEHENYGKISGLKYLLQFGEASKLWKHQKLLRKAEYYTNTHKRVRSFIYRCLLNRIQDKYSIHVPLNTCDKGLKIMHVGPVLINWNATIGKNCTFHLNTGVVAGGTNDYAPVLEDNIILGIGAVVLGNTHIASGVAVGANAVVNKNVDEPNITVAGIPAKKVSNRCKTDWAKK